LLVFGVGRIVAAREGPVPRKRAFALIFKVERVVVARRSMKARWGHGGGG